MSRRPGPRLPLAAALLAALVAAAPAAAELRLIPEPRRITPADGRLALRGDVTIAVPGGDPEDRFAAEGLRDEIESACGIRPQIVDAGAGTIVLARDPQRGASGDESYRIEVRPTGARLSAGTAAGMFYAVQTLRQMIEPQGIPAAAVEDRPALRWRGVHDDLSRGPMPTVEALERRIRTAAELKLNFYVLYLETAYAYRSQPLLAGTLTEADVRRLVEFARRRHVELVPEQQTTGHLSGVLRFERYSGLAEIPRGSTLAPGPASEAFVRSLYDELAPLFPGPFLHIGADEISEIGQGRTKAKVEAEGAETVYRNHLKALRDLLQPYGKRLMFWGDACVDHPGVLRGLPADLVAASWCFEAKDDYAKWIVPFREAKLDLIVCPGAINWNRVFPNLDVALPNIRDFVRQGRAAGAIGALTCTWADNGDAPFDLNWYALAGGAAASWQEAALDTTRLRRAFDWALFRNAGTEAADATAALQECHRLVARHARHDANLAQFWQHPLFTAMDRRLTAALEPSSRTLRERAETAIEGFARAKAGARRNADVLDADGFAARRMRSIGMRASAAVTVPKLYQEMIAAPRGSPEARQRLFAINAILVEGRETAVALRAEHERLWLAENRPDWLGNLLALYDRDIQVWIDKLDTFRQIELLMILGQPLPTAAALNLAP